MTNTKFHKNENKKFLVIHVILSKAITEQTNYMCCECRHSREIDNRTSGQKFKDFYRNQKLSVKVT
jgi:hypothetical protein